MKKIRHETEGETKKAKTKKVEEKKMPDVEIT